MNPRSAPISTMPSGNDQREWLSRLIRAVTPVEVGKVIIAMAASLPGCESASLVWSGEPCSSTRGGTLTPEEIGLARAALDGEGFCLGAGGRTAAWVLLLREQVVLVLRFHAVQQPAPLRAALATAFTMATRRLLQALELETLRGSHKQLERSESLQRALFAISDLAGSELDMPEMLRGIHAIVSTLMYGENFFIVRHDPLRRTWRFLYYADVEDTEGRDTGSETPLEQWRGTLTYHVLTSGKPLMGSAEELRAQVEGTLLKVGPDSNSWLGVPMQLDGQVHGALVVQSYKPGIIFTEEDRELLAFVGSHILTALERKQSKDALESHVRLRTQELALANRGLQQEIVERQRAEQLQAALFQLAQLATADIDESKFYQRVHEVVGALLNAENFFIGLIDRNAGKMTFPYYVDSTGEAYQERPLGRGLSEHVIAHGALRVDSQGMAEMERCGQLDATTTGTPSLGWLGVPLPVGDQVLGVVAVQSYTDSAAYSEADRELLSFAALQIANSINRRRTAVSLHESNVQLEHRVRERTQELRLQIEQREKVQKELKHQVMHDTLTGLPNRAFLRDRLDHVLNCMQQEPERHCALLYLDVDRFKVINDSLGHLAGDDFLKAVARRLQYCVRDPDVVARLSGDEFAILLEALPTPETAAHVAQRILHVLGAPLQIAGKELEPSASMGIAIGDRTHLKSDDLLRDADVALYRAKERGRKRFELFDETLAKDVVDVLTLEAELRHALQHDEFEPYFQPIYRLASQELVGMEALIRWNHPRRGLLGPGDFLKIAEDSGLIEQIDWRMFELSCLRFKLLQVNDCHVTINVSARHLRHDDFDVRLLELLNRTGLLPRQMVVEVTEGALLHDPVRVRDTLDRLRTAGVGAALDDFGSGYSSLNYLHSLPLQILKTDRAFVHELDKESNANSSNVVAAILALARALDMEVIAEGIETEAQRQMLIRMGCAMGQGYLMARPAPISRWLEVYAAAVD